MNENVTESLIELRRDMDRTFYQIEGKFNESKDSLTEAERNVYQNFQGRRIEVLRELEEVEARTEASWDEKTEKVTISEE